MNLCYLLRNAAVMKTLQCNNEQCNIFVDDKYYNFMQDELRQCMMINAGSYNSPTINQRKKDKESIIRQDEKKLKTRYNAPDSKVKRRFTRGGKKSHKPYKR